MELNKKEILALQKRYNEVIAELEKKGKSFKDRYGTDLFFEIMGEHTLTLDEYTSLMEIMTLIGMATMMKDFFGKHLPEDGVGLD